MITGNTLKGMLQSVLEDTLKNSDHVNTLISGLTSLAKQTTKLAEMMIRVQEKLQEHEKVMMFLMEQHDKKEASVGHFRKPPEKSSKPN